MSYYDSHKCYSYHPCKQSYKCKIKNPKKNQCNRSIPEFLYPQINPCPIVSYSTTASIPTPVLGNGTITTITNFSLSPIINGVLSNFNIELTNFNTNSSGFVSNNINNGLSINQQFPINNSNIITLSNGQFTIPISGQYLITTYIGFDDSTTDNGTRQLYIYKINESSGVTTLVSSNNRNATTGYNTYISIATVVDITANDKIYFAISQVNSTTTTLSTMPDARFEINRLC